MGRNTDFDRNNLDCLRLLLALIVALFHVYALTNIPAFSGFEKYLSPHFAVCAFFVISGMLVYRSYTRCSSLRSYFEKRFRRIYPAYFTTIVLAAAALSLLSSFPAREYFGEGFWKYLAANLIFLNHLAPTLPGVFQSHPEQAVDGALWTLKIEVMFYVSVPAIHHLFRRYGIELTAGVLSAASMAWRYGFEYLGRGTYPDSSSVATLCRKLAVEFPGALIYFLAGILLLSFFDKLKSQFGWTALLTATAFLVDHFWAKGALDVLWISGFVFVFSFWRYFGNFSKYGDMSYGLYIVHWPILQVMLSLGAEKLGPPAFLTISLALFTVISMLMWHLVERPSLRSSSHYRHVAAAEKRSGEEQECTRPTLVS